MKIENYERALDMMQCPYCARRADGGQPLYIVGSGLRCLRGHTFDIARKGYVNFIPNQKPLKGYDAGFFASRREFLAWGYYEHVRKAVVDELARIAPQIGSRGSQAPLDEPGSARGESMAIAEPQESQGPGEARGPQTAREPRGMRILDAGCGEGYYVRGVAEAFPDATVIGADIAKDAVALAAQGGDPRLWAVCDVANLPIADGALDCVLNIFTPANYTEFRRVLRPGGVVIKAIPGPGHLRELRDRLGDNGHSESDVVDIFDSHLDRVACIRATRTLDVPDAHMRTLLGMTPLTFSRDPAEMVGISVPRITIDAELLVGVFR